MLSTGQTPEYIIDKKGLKQISNKDELEQIIEDLLSKNQELVEQYRAGKIKVLGFFVGQVMKQTRGKGNPTLINNLLKNKLKA